MEDLPDGWHSSGDVMWKDFEHKGEQYSIAGGPRGVFLWSHGAPGIDIPSAILEVIWSILAMALSRTIVVKVRRRRWGPLRLQVLRREFPASQDLFDCVRSVEREVREGAGHI